MTGRGRACPAHREDELGAVTRAPFLFRSLGEEVLVVVDAGKRRGIAEVGQCGEGNPTTTTDHEHPLVRWQAEELHGQGNFQQAVHGVSPLHVGESAEGSLPGRPRKARQTCYARQSRRGLAERRLSDRGMKRV